MAEERIKGQGMFYMMAKRLIKNKAALAGLSIVLVLVVLAILSPWISPYKFTEINMKETFAAPSAAHFFGTDELGRDIFSRLLYGSRFSLQIGIFTVLLSSVTGIFFGAVAGYFGNAADNIIMRFMDIIQAIPGMLLSIVIAAVLGTGFDKCIIALAIGNVPNYARILRASIFTVRKMEYVEAASSINCSSPRIILRHILPNTLSPLIVQATMDVANAILAAAALSFVGLGVQPPNPEWGAMLSAGRTYIRDFPHLVIFPGLFIMITVLSLNMFGDGLRDALDPKLKN